MSVIGIDPGLAGALALMFGAEHDMRPDEVWDMPTVAKATGKGQQVDAAGLARILSIQEPWSDGLRLIVERQGARPGQGVTSMVSIGRSIGVIEGVAAALGLPIIWTAAGSWKRRAGLIGREKDASRTRALELWPSMAGELSRKKDVGRAEAMLIARYACGLGTT